MSIHIGANPGDIAETILLPGDPLRAQHLAETYLENPVQYNNVRGMLGFTGTYKGKRISVQGTGMGVPSISIYVHELINEFGCKNLIRVGTCGALQPQMNLRDVVLAMSASTNSQVNRLRFGGKDFAPTASFRLLKRAYDTAEAQGTPVHVGGIYTSDTFYDDDPEAWKQWAAYGILAVEMETTALYTLAAKFGVDALTILTVSDSLVSKTEDSSDVREKGYTAMMEIALELGD
jgi:purine-nucleoside phosphorylase